LAFLVIILAMLAILLPPPPKTTLVHPKGVCTNSQKLLSLALLNYENANGQFPGYMNRLGPNASGEPLKASWVVMLFPYLERQALWEQWESGTPTPVYQRVMVCLADARENPAETDTPLSYVVNCGRPGDEDTEADGVFFNHADGKPIRMTTEFLAKHDGAANTLMLSENLQAGNWTDTDEADLGMVWWDKPQECNRINRCTDVGDRPQNIQYARPSSNHGNGVVVSFCDGHVRFLRGDIDYDVYKQLMSPADGVPAEEDYD
jgi:prepilin-type processing-associated H-X9-DG protein